MKAAFEKASAMAGAINQTIGKAISVKEGKLSDQLLSASNTYAANTTVSYQNGPRPVSEKLATFSPGAISINAEVAVVFLLN